jgi:prepilin-type N-terminal cleavage/methylation domain-containing protein
MIVKKQNLKGFTLVEIIVVIVIIAILAIVAIPALTGYIDKAHRAQDLVSLRTLNMGTTLYMVGEGIKTEDVFYGISANTNRQQELFEKGYLEEIMVPKCEDVEFLWYTDAQLWGLSDEAPPLTPLGSTFDEITTGMLQLLLDNPGARSWNPYRYTDIGLDPVFWEQPVNHIIYTPKGNSFSIEPETGHTFFVLDLQGNEKKLKASYGWNLVYYIEDTWYFNSKNPGNEINIETLRVE